MANSNQKTFNPKNERVKNRYFKYLLSAKQKNIKSVDLARKSLMKYEEFSYCADFKAFNSDIAIAFKEYLLMQTSKLRNLPFSQHTVNTTLAGVKEFFIWLSHEIIYKKYIKLTDVAYLKPSLKEMSMVRKQGFVNYASLEETQTVIFFNAV